MATNFSETKPSAAMPLTILVVIAGVAAVVAAVARQAAVAEHAWLLMVVLALLLAPVSTVRIPGVKATVTLGDILTMTCAVLFGPSAGVIAAVADGVVTSLTLTKNPRKFLYNVATCAISMAGASLITRAAFDQFGTPGAQMSVLQMSGALGLLSISFFLISTSLVASFIALSKGESVWRLWRQKFLWTIMSYVGSGASALVAYSLVGKLGYMVFVVVIGAMFIMFLFYRSFFRRFQETA